MKNINENAFPSFDNSYELACDIQEDLEDCISDIFLKYQDVMNIMGDDMPFELEYDINKFMEQLSECISKALIMQK